MAEVSMLHELWEVARDRRRLGDWLSRYGYLGPYAGNLRSRSWRENAAPIHRLLATYRTVQDADAPGGVERQRVAARRIAEARLISAAPRTKRPGIRLLLKLAAHFIPLREVGKNSYLRAVDAARAGVRTAAADLARRGVLGDAEDIWFLTWQELLGELPRDVAATVERRRIQHAAFEKFTIPDLFHGCPEPTPLLTPVDQTTTAAEFVLHGEAASGGVAEGCARVIADPTTAEDTLQPGEILVAAATDPSWTTLFVGAAAVATDLGGALSHGAIVARELGLPCVTNLRTATTMIRTGDIVCVDGNRGTVTRLPPAAYCGELED